MAAGLEVKADSSSSPGPPPVAGLPQVGHRPPVPPLPVCLLPVRLLRVRLLPERLLPVPLMLAPLMLAPLMLALAPPWLVALPPVRGLQVSLMLASLLPVRLLPVDRPTDFHRAGSNCARRPARRLRSRAQYPLRSAAWD